MVRGPHPADLRILPGLGAGASPQAGATLRIGSPQSFRATRPGEIPPPFLQHGDGAKARRPDSVFLPKLGINWVKVSAARLSEEPRLFPAEGL